MSKKIPVSEIFIALQWEWPNIWKPTIFIRFFGCNKNCTWCDSKYSTAGKDYKLMSIEEIVEEIIDLDSYSVTFTWWEPTLFCEEMDMIMESLLSYEYFLNYSLETNGSNSVKNMEHSFHNISVSPKLINSGNSPYELKILPTENCEAIYKFVVDTEKDFKEVQKYCAEYDILCEDVYIMPQGTTMESQLRPEFVQLCLMFWYTLNLRQHILLHNDKRWV